MVGSSVLFGDPLQQMNPIPVIQVPQNNTDPTPRDTTLQARKQKQGKTGPFSPATSQNGRNTRGGRVEGGLFGEIALVFEAHRRGWRGRRMVDVERQMMAIGRGDVIIAAVAVLVVCRVFREGRRRLDGAGDVLTEGGEVDEGRDRAGIAALGHHGRGHLSVLVWFVFEPGSRRSSRQEESRWQSCWRYF
jgi:hypothetical protein